MQHVHVHLRDQPALYMVKRTNAAVLYCVMWTSDNSTTPAAFFVLRRSSLNDNFTSQKKKKGTSLNDNVSS